MARADVLVVHRAALRLYLRFCILFIFAAIILGGKGNMLGPALQTHHAAQCKTTAGDQHQQRERKACGIAENFFHNNKYTPKTGSSQCI